jgi:hypothetical protein
MIQPRLSNTLMTPFRNLSHPSLRLGMRPQAQIHRATLIQSIPSRCLSTGSQGSWNKSASISIPRQWPTALLGKVDRRPSLKSMGTNELSISRGMKVRSSVKKLCEGCKVRSPSPHSRSHVVSLISVIVRRASGGKAMSTLYARRIRNISSGKGEGW